MRPLAVAAASAALVCSIAAASAAPGQLDSRFGRGGMVTTTFRHASAAAHGLAIQRDGRIVVAGQRDVGDNGDFALARYRADGRLDRSFGGDGKVTTSFGKGLGGASAVAIQPDGKTVAVGEAFEPATTRWDIALARYRRDGSLDRGFGTDGKVMTPLGSFASASAVDLQRDGKIVVAGVTSTGKGFGLAIAIVRFNRDGSPDSSFGIGGQVQTEVAGGAAVARAMAIQRDGRIVVAGYRYAPNGSGGPVHGVLLLRYRQDGSLDPTLGRGGIVTTLVDGGGTGTALVLQRDGRIVVAGTTIREFTDVGPPFHDPSDVAVLLYRADGGLDPSFGLGGIVTTHVGSDGVADSVALRRDGRILVARSTTLSATFGQRSVFTVLGYSANGSLDSRFGRHGVVTTAFRGTRAAAYDIAIQRNGKAVAAGESDGAHRSRPGFALARYRSFSWR
jgi:uncharacterized delta-60 repeat protein